MYPLCGALGHRIKRMGFLPPHPDLDNAGVVLHQQTHRFPAEFPKLRQLANAIVFLGVTGIEMHTRVAGFPLSARLS